VTTGRLEAFSDGVFAIAITLLVLDIKVPHVAEGQLLAALRHQWPNYAAFLISFLVIGIMWVNHHTMLVPCALVDRPLLFLNLGLLMTVVALPFAAALFAQYVRAGADSHVAAAVYGAVMFVAALFFNGIWWWISRGPQLLHDYVDHAAARGQLRRFSVGIYVYGATIVLAFVSAPITLAVHFAIAVYYVVDRLAVSAGEPSAA
jgi:uncharacterized membrane protein